MKTISLMKKILLAAILSASSLSHADQPKTLKTPAPITAQEAADKMQQALMPLMLIKMSTELIKVPLNICPQTKFLASIMDQQTVAMEESISTKLENGSPEEKELDAMLQRTIKTQFVKYEEQFSKLGAMFAAQYSEQELEDKCAKAQEAAKEEIDFLKQALEKNPEVFSSKAENKTVSEYFSKIVGVFQREMMPEMNEEFKGFDPNAEQQSN